MRPVVKKPAPKVVVRCRDWSDGTLVWFEAVVVGHLLLGAALLVRDGPSSFAGWVWLLLGSFWLALHAGNLFPRRYVLEEGVFRRSGPLDKPVALNAVTAKRITLVSESEMILETKGDKDWSRFTIKGDDIGPMREALLKLMKRDEIIDLRPKVGA